MEKNKNQHVPNNGDYIILSIPEGKIMYTSPNYENIEIWFEKNIDSKTYGAYRINGDKLKLICLKIRVWEITKEVEG